MNDVDVYTKATARDYIYVDGPRVRSRLSQFAGGLPKEESGKRSESWQAGFSQVFVGSRSGGKEAQETRSLSDLHAAMLEDEAQAAGMLPDVTEHAAKAKKWFKARFRNIFEPGSLFKIHAPTQLTAPDEIVQLFSRMAALGAPDEMIEQMQGIVGSLYGKNLSIRIFPVDQTDPSRTFSGLFSDRDEYIGNESPLLIPRFGSSTPPLTVIAQVTRVSTQQDEPASATQSQLETLKNQMISGNSSVNRSGLESMLREMVKMLESSGVLESPMWPAIGILPLAVYRTVAATDPEFLGVSVPDE